MKLLRSLNLSYRLLILIGIFTAGFVMYGAWSFRTLDQLKEADFWTYGLAESGDTKIDLRWRS